MEMYYLLIILSVLGCCYGEDPIVNITATDPPTFHKTTLIEASSDKDVTLDCYVENLRPGTQVHWQRTQVNSKGRTTITDISEDEGANDNTQFGVEKPTQFTWRLRIKSIHPSQEGIYFCFVYAILQSKIQSKRFIKVYTPPTLDPEQTSSDMTVREGDEDVILMCNATGRPQPTIEWRKQGGKPLPSGGVMYQGAKLAIPVVRYNHRGIYYCQAMNKMKTIRREIELKVKFRPHVAVAKSNIEQAVGYQIELQCFIEANPHPKDIDLKWIRTRPGEGVKTISVSDNDYTVNKIAGAFNRLTYELIFRSVRENDFGNYECNVKNQEGSGSATVRLEQTDIPQKSQKLGRVVSGNASHTIICLSTLLMCLCSVLLHSL